MYHYHSETYNNVVFANTSGSSHSPLFGIMYDSIPVYGPYGDNGVVPTNLDACNGHTDTTHSFYHYHIPAGHAYPYLVACLSGCINSTAFGNNAAACTASSTQYNYSGFNATTQFVYTQAGKFTIPTTSSVSRTRRVDFSVLLITLVATTVLVLA